ncbi:Ubiquitin-conjugating enzyme E2 J1 [Blyttiomyces sp. JEL0837]|nr:Ubiquitin-conjugating enzyme E2 J1 [Blyttiomyces sp. JEL0837]
MSRSAAMKRLMKEYAELKADPSPELTAAPLEDNLLEWHFTIRGPTEGGFFGGRYHGRLLFPSDYPFKPPNIMFLTPNGRFELNRKICLSITGHHPEYWQPAWGVRSALIALISFLPTEGNGAIGALDYTSEERAEFAKKSRDWVCGICGCKNSEALPDESEVAHTELKGDPEITFSVKANGNGSAATSTESLDAGGNGVPAVEGEKGSDEEGKKDDAEKEKENTNEPYSGATTRRESEATIVEQITTDNTTNTLRQRPVAASTTSATSATSPTPPTMAATTAAAAAAAAAFTAAQARGPGVGVPVPGGGAAPGTGGAANAAANAAIHLAQVGRLNQIINPVEARRRQIDYILFCLMLVITYIIVRRCTIIFMKERV